MDRSEDDQVEKIRSWEGLLRLKLRKELCAEWIERWVGTICGLITENDKLALILSSCKRMPRLDSDDA